MEAIMSVRDAIRDFLRKFDEIITPVFRFVIFFFMFIAIKGMYGYTEIFGRMVVIFLLAVICSLVSDKVSVVVAGIVVLVNTLAVSKEMALVYLVMYIAMYCLYLRLFPDTGWVLLLVPIMCMLKLKYAAAIIVAIFAGTTGIIPAAFGLILFYCAEYTKEINTTLAGLGENSDFSVFDYMKEQLLGNRQMMLEIIVFAVVILITSIIYRLSFNYSWYVAIGVGGIMLIIVFAIGSAALKADISMGQVVVGSLVGMVVSLIIQVCKSLVDYSRKEKVQFEDDEYYYYVTAVPKIVGEKKKAEFEKEKAAKKEAAATNTVANRAGNAVNNARQNNVRQNNTNNVRQNNANNVRQNNANNARQNNANNARQNNANNARQNNANNARQNNVNNARQNNANNARQNGANNMQRNNIQGNNR